MKTYTLKLKTTSTTNYNLYDGTTLVSDTDLGTLFGSAGEAYFAFDFNSLTPTNLTSLTILNSNDTAVITNTGLSGIAENKNFKGTWSASATAFDSFTLLGGVAMDEAQLSKLVGLAKDGKIKTLSSADYDYPTDNPTKLAFVNLRVGIYKVDNGGTALAGLFNGKNVWIADGSLLIVPGAMNTSTSAVITSGPQGYDARLLRGTTPVSGSCLILSQEDVINNLTSNDGVVPLSAKQGKVLKDLIDSLVIKNAGAPTTSTTGTKGQLLEDTTNGNLYICTNSASPYAWKQIDKDEILTNAGAPTTSTVGTLGQLLTDTTNAKLYQLTAIDTTDPQNPSYTWSEVGGGSGPTVVQTTGTSTTDVMSQNAVTGMVYADPSTQSKVRLMNTLNSNQMGNAAIAIGTGVEDAAGDIAIALGTRTRASARGSIAIGSGAYASRVGQLDIGSSYDTTAGYNSSKYRLLTGLYDPQSAHDAATKGYVDTAVASAGADAFTTNEWNALWS